MPSPITKMPTCFALALALPLSQRPSTSPPVPRPRAPRCSQSDLPPRPDVRPEGGSGLDGELRDALESSVRDAIARTPDAELRAADRRVFDGIVEVGTGGLEALGGQFAGRLAGAGDDLAARADDVFEGELEKTMARFEERRGAIMADALKQRDVIREEAGLIQRLAAELSGPEERGGDKAKQRKLSALFAASGLLALAALTYAWRGFVDESAEALQSGALDAVAAASAAYFYVREKNSSGGDAEESVDGREDGG